MIYTAWYLGQLGGVGEVNTQHETGKLRSTESEILET